MIQKTVDGLVLSGAAVTLQVAVILLKWMRRRNSNKTGWENLESRSTASQSA